MSSSTTITMSRSFSAPNEAMMALRCKPSCVGPGLLHLNDGVEAVQAARRHLGVGDDRHRGLQHLEQARLQHVLAQHHGLAAVAVDGVIDRLRPVRDRGDFQHRRRIGRRQIADELAERAFLDLLVALQHALQHDLALGRHQQILRHRLHDWQRPAAQPARDRKLVGALGHLRAHRRGGVMQREVGADTDHHRQVLALLLGALERRPQMAAEIELDGRPGSGRPASGGDTEAL